MKYFKSALITFLSNIVLFFISFIITVITSRFLGTEGRGIVGVINNVTSFGVIILGFGITSSNIFFIGKYKKKANEILGFNLILSIITSAVLVIVYVINANYKLNFLFKNLDNRYVLLALVFIPIMNIKNALSSLFLGMHEIVFYNKLNILDKMLNVVLLILLLIPFNSAMVVVLSNLVSTLVIALIFIYKIFVKNKSRISYDKRLNSEMIKYSLKCQLGNAIQIVNYRLDVFIINYYLGFSEVGMYSNAVVLAETLWRISSSVATIIFPATASSKDKENIKDDINKITRITFYIVLVFSIILMLLSRFIVLMFFGRAFIQSSYALVILIPGVAIFSICNILSNYIAGVGLLEKNIISSTISCIVTVVLDFVLIPRFGMIGAAIATSSSYIVFTIIVLHFYTKMTSSALKDIFVLKKEDVALIKEKLSTLKLQRLRRK